METFAGILVYTYNFAVCLIHWSLTFLEFVLWNMAILYLTLVLTSSLFFGKTSVKQGISSIILFLSSSLFFGENKVDRRKLDVIIFQI